MDKGLLVQMLCNIVTSFKALVCFPTPFFRYLN